MAASRQCRPLPGIGRCCSTLGMLVGIGLLSWGVQASAQRPLPRLLMGTRSSNHTATLVYNPHPAPGFGKLDISLHILIATIGRRSIFVLLESLAPQVEMQDHITVVFDAKDVDNVLNDVNAELARMPGIHRTVMEVENSNDWGASIRSKHQLKEISHFVMFADDDNHYEPDALQVVRTTVQHDLDGLYIFQMRYEASPGHLIPNLSQNRKVEIANVDTGRSKDERLPKIPQDHIDTRMPQYEHYSTLLTTMS